MNRTKEELESIIRQDRRAVLLVNAGARRGAAFFPEAERLLQRAGFVLDASTAVRGPAELAAAVESALRWRPALVVVGSGDGTVSAVVDQLAYRDTVLGYLPLGTTNNFGRSLGLPMDPRAAVGVITSGKVVDVDLGCANGDYFTNELTLGVSVRVAAQVTDRLKRRLGRLAYGLTAARILPRHAPITLTITVDGRTRQVITRQLGIASGRSHAGAPITAGASIDDHTLTAYSLAARRRELVVASLRQALGRPRALAADAVMTGRRIVVTAQPPEPVELDGEISTSTPLEVTIAAEALNVMVPRAFADT
ncbi:MAG: diacylglycerol/lipid kinase family protein [Mycobacteriales bacterium]